MAIGHRVSLADGSLLAEEFTCVTLGKCPDGSECLRQAFARYWGTSVAQTGELVSLYWVVLMVFRRTG